MGTAPLRRHSRRPILLTSLAAPRSAEKTGKISAFSIRAPPCKFTTQACQPLSNKPCSWTMRNAAIADKRNNWFLTASSIKSKSVPIRQRPVNGYIVPIGASTPAVAAPCSYISMRRCAICTTPARRWSRSCWRWSQALPSSNRMTSPPARLIPVTPIAGGIDCARSWATTAVCRIDPRWPTPQHPSLTSLTRGVLCDRGYWPRHSSASCNSLDSRFVRTIKDTHSARLCSSSPACRLSFPHSDRFDRCQIAD